jgi:hypothetical protein
MGLAIGRAYPRAGAASDAGAVVIHHHNFLFNLIVLVIVEGDKFAIFIEAFQRHHLTAADLIATATADTFLGIDIQKKFGLPGTSISSCM